MFMDWIIEIWTFLLRFPLINIGWTSSISHLLSFSPPRVIWLSLLFPIILPPIHFFGHLKVLLMISVWHCVGSLSLTLLLSTFPLLSFQREWRAGARDSHSSCAIIGYVLEISFLLGDGETFPIGEEPVPPSLTHLRGKEEWKREKNVSLLERAIFVLVPG